jgi:hypothetical protein
MSTQFLCVRCGQLTQQCICDHSTPGKQIETELAFRSRVLKHLVSIDEKLARLEEILGLINDNTLIASHPAYIITDPTKASSEEFGTSVVGMMVPEQEQLKKNARLSRILDEFKAEEDKK